jgi:hypothetical protein
MGSTAKYATRVVEYATKIATKEPGLAKSVALTSEAIAAATKTAKGLAALEQAMQVSGVVTKKALVASFELLSVKKIEKLQAMEEPERATPLGKALTKAVANAKKDESKAKGVTVTKQISTESASNVPLRGLAARFAANWGISRLAGIAFRREIPGDTHFKDRVLAAFIKPPKAQFQKCLSKGLPRKCSRDETPAVCTSKRLQESARDAFMKKVFPRSEAKKWNETRHRHMNESRHRQERSNMTVSRHVLTDYEKYTAQRVRVKLSKLADTRLELFMQRGCCKIALQILAGVCNKARGCSEAGSSDETGSEAVSSCRVGKQANVYCPKLVAQNSRRFLKVNSAAVSAWANRAKNLTKEANRACEGKERAEALFTSKLAHLNRLNQLEWDSQELKTYYFFNQTHSCAAEFHLRVAQGKRTRKGRKFCASESHSNTVHCTDPKKQHRTVVVGGLLTEGNSGALCAGPMSEWLDKVKAVIYQNAARKLPSWPHIGQGAEYIEKLRKRCNMSVDLPHQIPIAMQKRIEQSVASTIKNVKVDIADTHNHTTIKQIVDTVMHRLLSSNGHH